MLARNDSGGRDRFFMRAIIGDLSFRGHSSAELLSSIIYISFDDFLSEISEVSYTLQTSGQASACESSAHVFPLPLDIRKNSRHARFTCGQACVYCGKKIVLFTCDVI